MTVILIILGLIIAGVSLLLGRRHHPKVPKTPGPAPLPNGVHLTLVVQSTSVSPTEVATYLEAQQMQIDLDFSSAWGGSATIDRSPGGWPVYLQDVSDVQNALGYHDVDSKGVPFGRVFVQTAKDANVPWQTVASHEVLEILGDSNANTFDLGPDGCQWVQETGDPVEDQSYFRMGVPLSDFVTPSWFTVGGQHPFDFLRVLKAPFTVTAGGYAQEVCNGKVKVIGGAADKSVDRDYKDY